MKKMIVLLLSLFIAIVCISCKKLPQETSSATESNSSSFPSIYSELANNDETMPTDETSSEPTPTISKKEPVNSTPVPTTSVPADTTGNTSSTTSTTETRKVVQLADPETGISWDGVSPIVYTYPDGTTGTEKRDGATYEQVPGIIDTVNLVAESYVSNYDGTCKQCGKKGWDGTNGTCGRWLEDIECPNCGEHVEALTCHTCDE